MGILWMVRNGGGCGGAPGVDDDAAVVGNNGVVGVCVVGAHDFDASWEGVASAASAPFSLIIVFGFNS